MPTLLPNLTTTSGSPLRRPSAAVAASGVAIGAPPAVLPDVAVAAFGPFLADTVFSFGCRLTCFCGSAAPTGACAKASTRRLRLPAA